MFYISNAAQVLKLDHRKRCSMTRLLHALALAALILPAVLSLDARLAGVRADDEADCSKGSGDTVIRGCSRIIKSGRMFGTPISKEHLALIYKNRGEAYRKCQGRIKKVSVRHVRF